MARLPTGLLPILLCLAVCSAAYGDADSDGIPDSTDICPLFHNPEQRGLVKLNAPLVAGGEVQEFALSPDGSWAVYIADQDTDDMFELYRVSVDGGTPLKLNAPLIAAGDVASFRISPDSSRVVYRADQTINSWTYAYSVPLTGGTPILLSPGLRMSSAGLEISPDSSWVAFITPDSEFMNPVYCTTPITGGATYLHDTFQPTGEGNSYGGKFSPDSQWFLFLDHSGSPSASARLYRTPPEQSGKSTVSFSIAGPAYDISPDSARVVYGYGDMSTGQSELRSEPLSGGSYVTLNDPGASLPYTRGFTITAVEIDGNYRVVYGDDYSGLVSIAIDGSDRIVLDPTLNPRLLEISQDGGRVLYGSFRLLSVDILGESAPLELSGPMAAGGSMIDFAISPDGERAVYLADQDTDGMNELFAVPIAHTGEVKLSSALFPDGDVDGDYLIGPDGQSVLYRADHVFDELFALFAASIHGGEVLRLSETPPAGGPIQSFSVTSDGARTVYLGDPEVDGVNELYSILLDTDADADGVYGSCDCAPNDDLVWTVPQEVSDLFLEHSGGQLGTTTLTWSAVDYSGAMEAAVYDTLRSSLKDGFQDGSGAVISCVETDDGSDTTSDDSSPPADAYFYLVRAGNRCGEGAVGTDREAGVQATCP